MMKRILDWLDFTFNKLIPKKMMVWGVATFLTFNGKLDGEYWAYISMIYLGGNVIQKFAFLQKGIKDEDK